MKNLSSRIISAVVALILLSASLYFWEEKGLYWIVFLVVVRGSFEAARMFFDAEYPPFIKRLFVSVASVTFLIITPENLRNVAGVAIILSFVLVASLGILFHKYFKNLDQIFIFVAK